MVRSDRIKKRGIFRAIIAKNIIKGRVFKNLNEMDIYEKKKNS